MTSEPEARRLYDSGIDAYRAGEYEEALEMLTRARSLYAGAGNRKEESEALNDMGVVCTQLEQWDDAQQYLDEALTIRMALENRSGQGITLGNLGTMYDRQGDEEKAAEAYEQAITIFRELGEWGNEKAVARQLRKLKVQKGKYLDALGDYQEELAGEEAPSGPQRLARRLYSLLGRLTGGGPIQETDEDDVIDVEAESDAE